MRRSSLHVSALSALVRRPNLTRRNILTTSYNLFRLIASLLSVGNTFDVTHIDQAPRLLIVDDDAIFNRLIGHALARLGYDIVGVPDSKEAMEALARRRFDLVLADIDMPGNRQLEMLKNVVSRYPLLPVVLMTGYPETQVVIDALRSGATDFFVKPCDIGHLHTQLQRLLVAVQRKRRARQALDAISSL